MSWTACFEDECWVHRSDKDGAYYPQAPQQRQAVASFGWETQPEERKKTPTGPRKRPNRDYQTKKEGHARTSYRNCYRDGCRVHLDEKRATGIWPRKPLPGSARTLTTGRGSEKQEKDDERAQFRLKMVELMQELQKEQMETARLRMELDRKDQTLQGVVGANERLRQELAEQKNNRQRDENQTLLTQIGASKDRPDVSQSRPVALWDQRWRRKGATVTNRDLARQISHD